jgi:hypothetical protein
LLAEREVSARANYLHCRVPMKQLNFAGQGRSPMAALTTAMSRLGVNVQRQPSHRGRGIDDTPSASKISTIFNKAGQGRVSRSTL